MITEDVLPEVLAAFRAEVRCDLWPAIALLSHNDPSLLSEPELRRAAVWLTRIVERAIARNNQGR